MKYIFKCLPARLQEFSCCSYEYLMTSQGSQIILEGYKRILEALLMKALCKSFVAYKGCFIGSCQINNLDYYLAIDKLQWTKLIYFSNNISLIFKVWIKLEWQRIKPFELPKHPTWIYTKDVSGNIYFPQANDETENPDKYYWSWGIGRYCCFGIINCLD